MWSDHRSNSARASALTGASDLRGIALLSPGWPEGVLSNGIVSYVARMRPALSNLGIRVSVLAAQLAVPTEDSQVVGLGSESEPAWLKAIGRIAPGFRRFRMVSDSIVAGLSRLQPPVQLVEMEESFGWARRVRAKARIPVVVRLHGPWFLNGEAAGAPKNAAFHRRIRREGRAIEAADAVVAPSHDVLEQVRQFYGLPLENSAVIPNPVAPHPESWSRDSAEPDRILFVGRFDRHKGGDVIVRAFAKVATTIQSAHLAMVGPDSGYMEETGRVQTLDSYIAAHVPPEVAGRILKLGERHGSDLVAERIRAAVTVVSSRYETFSYTAVEAMSMGCPLIVADAGALRELVQGGRNGLLFRTADPDDLARQIIAQLRDPSRAARMGAQGREDCANRYHPNTTALRAFEVYQQTLARATCVPRSPGFAGSIVAF